MWWRPSPERRFRRDKYADYFQCLDRNGNGRIDRNDFGHYASVVQERLRLPSDSPKLARLRATTQALWASITGPMDGRGEGSVRFDELVGFFVDVHEQSQDGGELPRAAQDHVLATFAVLDMDGDGFIDVQDYDIYLSAIGSDSDANDAFAHLDPDGAGRLSMEALEKRYREWVSAGDPAVGGNYLLTGRLPD
ncbi:MAG: hypothetical protein H6719_28725 [Sandaracinaceae bacterium]|nr:hypothetical protein [Sandaracinaceae bacterium]